MSFDHSLSGSGIIKEGKTLDDLVAALDPLLSYLQIDGHAEFLGSAERSYNHEFHFDSDTREFSVYTCGDVGHSFPDLVEQCIPGLSGVVAKAGSLEFTDMDTADVENAKSCFVFGPDERSILDYQFADAIAGVRGLLATHLKEQDLEAALELITGMRLTALEGNSDER